MFYFCRSSWIWISFMTQLQNYFYACMLGKNRIHSLILQPIDLDVMSIYDFTSGYSNNANQKVIFCIHHTVILRWLSLQDFIAKSQWSHFLVIYNLPQNDTYQHHSGLDVNHLPRSNDDDKNTTYCLQCPLPLLS